MQLSKFFSLVLVGVVSLITIYSDRVLAGDHNNLDANRPLDFDDADSIGFREQAIDLGGSFIIPQDESVEGEFEVEYLYGFAPNTHLNLGIDFPIDSQLEIGDLSVGVLHNFNREYNNTPAFAVRGDAVFPTGKDSQGMDFHLRGIASKTVGQYNRLHLNVDLNFTTVTENEEKSFFPGVILGYSRPIGYPESFTRTLLAEVGVKASQIEEDGAVVSLGIGLRQQVGYQSVLDLGIKGNIAGESGESSDLRLVAGYSWAF